MKKVLLFLILTSSLFSFQLSAQISIADSLNNLLSQHTRNDTLRVNLLNKLAEAFLDTDKDKAFSYATEADSLSTKLNFSKGKATSLFIIGKYYRANANLSSSIKNFKKSIIAAKDANAKRIEANSNSSIGTCFFFQGEYNEAIEYYKKASLLYKNDNLSTEYASTLKNIGNVYLMIGNWEYSNNFYQKALVICIKINDQAETAKVYNNLGLLNFYQDKYYDALDFYMKALSIYETTDDREATAGVLNGIGTVYHRMDNYSEALDYYNKALKISTELDDKMVMGLCLANIGMIYGEKKEYERANNFLKRNYKIMQELGIKEKMGTSLNNQANYLRPGEDLLSLQLHFEALSIFEEIESENGKCYAFLGLAQDYFNLHNIYKSEFYASKGLELSIKFSRLSEQGDAHYLLSKIYEINKNFEKAFKHHKEFKEIQDSLFNESNIKKITNLENQYKFEKEKQAIAFEQMQKDVVTAENDKRQKVIQYVLIGSGVLFIMIALIIFIFLVQKRRANKILTQQKEEINSQNKEKELLLKEIHHRVKNNLQIISSLLNLQLEENEDNSSVSLAIRDGQSRVKAMALIHEKLYQNDTLSTINFKGYSEQLLKHIADAYAYQKIVHQINIDKLLELDIDTAIPLGLILNELITNAYKYAFKNEEGTISITVTKQEHNYILVVKDTGEGIDEGIDISSTTSIGLKIVRRLSTQLYGNMTYKYAKGAIFTINFKDAIGRNIEAEL